VVTKAGIDAEEHPMVEQGARYAIYFVPEVDSHSIVWQCDPGLRLQQQYGRAISGGISGDAAGWRRTTEEPRRYGFHATLKAPFRLSSSCTEAQLESALQSFAGLGHSIPTIVPAVTMVDNFAAVTSRRREPAIDALAAKCTTIFDAFRAPMSPRERARRVTMGLNLRQIQHLDRWGYPHVFADFRFHMSLTGPIEMKRRKPIFASLRRCFRRMQADAPIAIDRLALIKQDSLQAMFRVIRHVLLRRMP
jgi:hypothetical protein